MQGTDTSQMPHRMWVTISLLLYGVLLASSGTSLAQGVVTYDDDVLPQVFEPFCIVCHSSELVGPAARRGAPSGVDYDTFEFATEGTNEERAVVRILDEINPMPPPGFFPDVPDGILPQALQDLMIDWQSAGFPENQGSVEPSGELMAAADVSGDFNVPEDTRVRLDGTDSRAPDGTLPDIFSWIQTEGPPVRLNDPQSSAPSFIAPDVDTVTQLVFELTVIDGGEVATATVAVNVFDVAQPFSEEAETGNGGCAMHPGTSFDPVLLGLAGFVLVFLGWRRSRRRGRP